MTHPAEVVPKDEHNLELVRNVHPPDWTDPAPAPRYNLVVIGGGTAGLVSAGGAAILGARVALVESHLMGGDCLNYGCVPSKAFISSSKALAGLRRAGSYGIGGAQDGEADFAAVMERVRRLRARISHHDSVERFSKLGVDIFLGQGRFSGPDTVEVESKALRFKKAVIATGSRPLVPPIEGLAEAGCLTNETVFSLTGRPKRLLVLGGGPIGCELAQAFQRLGSDVILLEMERRILPREDSEAAEIVTEALRRDGVDLRTGSKTARVERAGGEKRVHLERNGRREAVSVDEILVAVGRMPNVDHLNLEAAGVRYDPRKGVEVNDRLRTTNRRIYAAGDVSLPYQFTHTADAAARIVLQNSLFPPRKKLSALTVPGCTYTDPEVAHVGLSERDAQLRGIDIETIKIEMSEVDRAIVEGEDEGFVKIHVRKGRDRILGATIVATHAGEMISEITLAMVCGAGLNTIVETIHPYPTRAEAIKMAADSHARKRLTPFVQKLLARWLSWTR